MEKTNKEYLDAAELVAHCKPSKLPYVLALLEQGGFAVGEEEIKAAKKNIGRDESWVVAQRKNSKHENWKDTDDEIILALRDAFMKGVSLSKIASVAGVHCASVYKALYGRVPTDYMRERIVYGLEEAYGIEVE